MKKILAGFVMVVLMAMSGMSLQAAQQSVAGEWTMLVQDMSLRLALVQEGEKISGTLESPHGLIPLKGDFSKGKLTIAGASTETHPVQFAGTATLAPDGSLAGNISANLVEMPFTAVRASAR